MTKGEMLMNKRDEQTRQARECLKKGDNLGAEMHKNCADGFQLKLEKLTGNELSEEV